MLTRGMHRDEVTPATRIMVPAYAIFFGWIGLSHVLTPLQKLLLTPGLRHTQPLVDLRIWGAIFLSISAALVFAMIRPGSHKARPTAAYVLLVAVITMGIWMFFLIGASIFGEASIGAGAYAFLPMSACYATYRALTR